MNKKFLAVAAAALAVAGCATSKQVSLPDGRAGYSLNCSGSANDWGSCLQKAGEVCGGRPYDIAMRDERTGQSTIIMPTQYGLLGNSIPTVNREMIVACK